MFQKYKNRRILICESRSLSYGSSGFFLERIEEELQSLGVETKHFILQEDHANLNDLEQLIGMTFDAVLDINSYLPLMVCDDGSYFLDHLDAPFYNYIVDHPMHLHPILEKTPANYSVICLDPAHKRYIERYYSHIREVIVMPLAGQCGPNADLPYPERPWEIYFPATYTPLVEYEAKMQGGGTDDLAFVSRFLKRSKTEDAGELTDWFQEEEAITGNPAAEIYRRCRYMDRYIREVYRHEVIEILLTEGLQLHVSGAYWEYYDGAGADNLIIHPSCDYPTMLEQMGNSRIVLNVQPLFRHAPHDRICNGMANGAVVLTDSCAFLRNQLSGDKPYLLYHRERLAEDAATVRRLLEQPEYLEGKATQAKKWASENNTWRHWAKHFLDAVLGGCEV